MHWDELSRGQTELSKREYFEMFLGHFSIPVPRLVGLHVGTPLSYIVACRRFPFLFILLSERFLPPTLPSILAVPNAPPLRNSVSPPPFPTFGPTTSHLLTTGRGALKLPFKGSYTKHALICTHFNYNCLWKQEKLGCAALAPAPSVFCLSLLVRPLQQSLS
jgi:hypothetical protein